MGAPATSVHNEQEHRLQSALDALNQLEDSAYWLALASFDHLQELKDDPEKQEQLQDATNYATVIYVFAILDAHGFFASGQSRCMPKARLAELDAWRHIRNTGCTQ